MTQTLPFSTCAKEVRRETEDLCGTKYSSKSGCPNKENHLWPIMTGFCNSGWHEGHKVNKPTCKFWINCPCKCHTDLSRLFAMSGEERRLVDESTYIPDRGGFVRVSLTEYITESVRRETGGVVVASPAPSIVPSSIQREFAATATGRAARGQLESQVRAVTDAWVQAPDGNCTPQWISDQIAKDLGVNKGPSTGAIDAVLKRWEAIGFAHVGRKPTRFSMYTIEGIKVGLEVLRARSKRR